MACDVGGLRFYLAVVSFRFHQKRIDASHRIVILIRQIITFNDEIAGLDLQLRAWHTENEASRKLAGYPGHSHAHSCCCFCCRTEPIPLGRAVYCLAWLDSATAFDRGDKTKLEGIAKRGDRYLRRLLAVGATAVIYGLVVCIR